MSELFAEYGSLICHTGTPPVPSRTAADHQHHLLAIFFGGGCLVEKILEKKDDKLTNITNPGGGGARSCLFPVHLNLSKPIGMRSSWIHVSAKIHR